MTTSPWRISHALLGRHGVDLRPVEGGAFLDDLDAEMRRHVEQDAARHHRRDLLDAELLQPADRRELAPLQAVVVAVADTDVAEAVELGADAGPAVEDVVVVGRVRRPEALGGADLAGLDDVDGAGAGREGRRRRAHRDAQRVHLAGLDQPRRLQGVRRASGSWRRRSRRSRPTCSDTRAPGPTRRCSRPARRRRRVPCDEVSCCLLGTDEHDGRSAGSAKAARATSVVGASLAGKRAEPPRPPASRG